MGGSKNQTLFLYNSGSLIWYFVKSVFFLRLVCKIFAQFKITS